MSKETIKMNSIRIMRIGIKEVLSMAEKTANSCRHTIQENWDKDGDKDCRRTLNKAHKRLAKARKVINECQMQLMLTKRELKKLNHQHDFRVNAVSRK